MVRAPRIGAAELVDGGRKVCKRMKYEEYLLHALTYSRFYKIPHDSYGGGKPEEEIHNSLKLSAQRFSPFHIRNHFAVEKAIRSEMINFEKNFQQWPFQLKCFEILMSH